MYKKICLFVLLFFLFTPKVSADFNAATSIVYFSGDANNYDLNQKVDEAVNKLKQKWGSTTNPKAVLIINNFGNWDYLYNQIKTNFGQSVIIGGHGTASMEYNAFTEDAFVSPPSNSLALLAIGGSDITQITMQGKRPNNNDFTQLGKDLAIAIKPYVKANEQNVINIFGPGHYNENVLFLKGFKEAYGTIPSNLSIIGAPGYPNGNSTINGVMEYRAVTVLLISGNFKVERDGVGEGFNGDPLATVDNILQGVVSRLGGEPNLVFFVPGHPDNEGVSFNDFKQMSVNALGSNTAIFGNEGGGEYGHCLAGKLCGDTTNNLTSNTGDAVAGQYHFFVTAIKGSTNNNTNPTPSTQPTNTQPNYNIDFDPNRDGQINLKDVIDVIKFIFLT